MTNRWMRLDRFTNPEFDRGASRWKELLWIVVQSTLFATWLPGSFWRVIVLRLFGARVGYGVVIKPHVFIKFPWKLKIDDHVWVGQRVWIDNLGEVSIGAHSCLSQGAYLCTGSHDWGEINFGLIVKSILIGRECWIGARASLSPGSVMEDGAVLAMTALGKGRLIGGAIHLVDGTTRKRRVKSGPNK